MSNTEINHEYTDEIVCPYCGYEFSCSNEYIEDGMNSGEIECPDCEKDFIFNANFSVDYVTQKICQCKHSQNGHDFITAGTMNEVDPKFVSFGHVGKCLHHDEKYGEVGGEFNVEYVPCKCKRFVPK